MAKLITKDEVKLHISNMMGKRAMPQGDTSDWERFAQEAFDYAWRYHKWGFSLKSATVTLTGGTGSLPSDVDLDGYITVPESANATYDYLDTEVYAAQAGLNNPYVFTTTFDTTNGTYGIITPSQATSLDIVYQTAPPPLSDTGVPFYSAMTIAEGALIFAKQAENPTRADVTQEWDAFHSMLNRHVGYSRRNQPKTPRRTYQTRYGGYTGRTV